MKPLFLALYICSIILLIYKSVKMVRGKQSLELVMGLSLTFAMVPDFMIFDYLGLHISFAFVLLFSYVVPLLVFLSRSNGTIKIIRYEYKLWTFLVLLLIHAIFTLLVHTDISSYYNSKLLSCLYSVVLYLFIVSIYQKDFVSCFEKYSDIILIAIITYVFKNFYMAGIENFRYIYETYLQEYKNVIFASRILGLGIIISIYMYQNTTKVKYIAISMLMLVQMIMLESRGPVISLVATMVLIWLLKKSKTKGIRKRLSANIKKIAIVLVVMVAIYYIVMYLYNNGFLNRFIYKYNYLKMGRKEDRNVLYSTCLEILINSLPFGVGFGNTDIALQSAGSTVIYNYPHNILLEVFMEDGIIVGIAFLWLVLSYVFLCIKGKATPKKMLFVALMIFYLINSMFSGDIIGNNWVFIIGVFLNCFMNENHEMATEWKALH